VLLSGMPFNTDRRASRRAIGVVGHQSYLYPELTVAENLAFYARLYRVPTATVPIDDVLRVVGLHRRRDDRVATLSRGMTQRAALARAIVHDPSVLLLDEPDTGLDIEGLTALEEIVRPPPGLVRTVVLSTHNLEHALRLCDRIVVLRDGRIVDDRPSIDLDAPALRDGYHRLIGQAMDPQRGAR
jgi:heme exporter protein A